MFIVLAFLLLEIVLGKRYLLLSIKINFDFSNAQTDISFSPCSSVTLKRSKQLIQ